MEKITKSKTENNNYWGYIIFAISILIYIPFGDTIWGASNPTNRTARTNNRETHIQTNQNNTETTSSINYCSLSINELIKTLSKENNYTLNGNGSVRFTTRYSISTDEWLEKQIIISGNGKRLEGKWKLLANNKISITDLIVTSGGYDASRNSRTRGMLILDCNGNLKGMLMDPNGNRKDISITKSR